MIGFTKAALLGLAILGVSSGWAAESIGDYPSRPIRMVVTFAPGGGADFLARLVSEPLSKVLGQPVVVENKPGGGGTVGASMVARSEPDGYTLLYTTPGPQITNPFLMKSLSYDPVKDLVPVSRIAIAPSVLVVNKNVAANSIAELIDQARKHPHQIRYASAGVGASSHLSGELFRAMAGIEIDHVPYRGTGAAMNDLLGGNVEMAIDTVAVYLPHIKAGTVKALGVTTPVPLPILPGVPPIGDQLAGFDASPVNYLSVPGKTPAAIIAKLNAAVNQVLKQPEVKDRMLKAAMISEGSTPQEMADQIKSEAAKWKKVIELSGARLD